MQIKPTQFLRNRHPIRPPQRHTARRGATRRNIFCEIQQNEPTTRAIRKTKPSPIERHTAPHCATPRHIFSEVPRNEPTALPRRTAFPPRAGAKQTHLTPFLALLGLLFLSLPVLAQNKPNLILILCDDLGYGDLGSYGNTTIKTPNLDRLAKEGIRFTDFYCAGAQCTPSRAGMLTGRYPVRFGLTYTLMTNAGAGIPNTETLLPQLLQKQGYATMLAGKWHLGDQPRYHPLRHGFTEFFGVLRGHDTEPRQLWHNNQIVDQEAPLETLTQRYTTAAADFIAAQSKKKQPFFLMLAHTYPHTPLTGTYAQAVEEIDHSTKQILAALAANKLEDNTLIFFTSDNGASVDKGPEGGSTGPFRAGKFSTYEGGVRIPAIAWFPSKIKPRTESQPAILLDLFPTFANIAGAKIPASLKIDGQDLTPLLFENGKRNGTDFYFYMQDKLQAHRSENWKLKLADKPNTPPELYDLSKDPGEATDVAKDNPEIVKRLQQQMAAEEKSLNARH
jgi:arylsulfatase A